ncbi:MAG: aldose 1-epimerase [Devosia sp.]
MAATSDPEILTLEAGPLALGIVPEVGGSLAFFRCGGQDVMRALTPERRQARDVLGVAMFPMVPYANRIAGNAFAFGGRTWHFAANNPPERFNVHGTGWHLPWEAERTADGVRLHLEHLAPDEPYSYEATQTFALDAAELRVDMRLTNRGPVAMPFGMGLHPWFDRDADTELRFEAGDFYMEGPEGIATERLRTPPELDFSAGRRLPDTWRNNDYGGWAGTAEIRWPARGIGLRMTADPLFGHLMLYADPERPFFCLEPQSNAPTAFNRIASGREAGMGVVVLEPNETMSGTIRFAPFRL